MREINWAPRTPHCTQEDTLHASFYFEPNEIPFGTKSRGNSQYIHNAIKLKGTNYICMN